MLLSVISNTPSPNFTLLSSLYCSTPTLPLYYHPFDFFSLNDLFNPFILLLTSQSVLFTPPLSFFPVIEVQAFRGEIICFVGFDSWSETRNKENKLCFSVLSLLFQIVCTRLKKKKFTIWSAVMSCWLQGRQSWLYNQKPKKQGYCVRAKYSSGAKLKPLLKTQRETESDAWMPLK